MIEELGYKTIVGIHTMQWGGYNTSRAVIFESR